MLPPDIQNLIVEFILENKCNDCNKSFSKKIVTPDILGSSKYGTNYVGDFIADNIMELDGSFNINDENIGLGKSTII